MGANKRPVFLERARPPLESTYSLMWSKNTKRDLDQAALDVTLNVGITACRLRASRDHIPYLVQPALRPTNAVRIASTHDGLVPLRLPGSLTASRPISELA